MKALINPEYNNQVQDVQPEKFPVVEPLYFVDCPPDIIPYVYTYNPDTKEFIRNSVFGVGRAFSTLNAVVNSVTVNTN